MSTLGLSCAGCISDKITLFIASMGKGSKDGYPMEIWNMKLFAIGEVERFS